MLTFLECEKNTVDLNDQGTVHMLSIMMYAIEKEHRIILTG
jgi:hypothetical protein